jgi:hypothetical protein
MGWRQQIQQVFAQLSPVNCHSEHLKCARVPAYPLITMHASVSEVWLKHLWNFMSSAESLSVLADSGWPVVPCVSTSAVEGAEVPIEHRWLVPLRSPSSLLLPGGFPSSTVSLLFQVPIPDVAQCLLSEWSTLCPDRLFTFPMIRTCVMFSAGCS